MEVKKYNTLLNLFRYRFELVLEDSIPSPPTRVSKIEFPTHKLEAKRALDIAKFYYANALNREIHERLDGCHSRELKIGSVEFSDFGGTIYLVWAQVTRININGVRTCEKKPQPVLIFKDGHNKFQKVLFLFHEHLQVNVKDCAIVDLCTLWCLESAKPKTSARFRAVDVDEKKL